MSCFLYYETHVVEDVEIIPLDPLALEKQVQIGFGLFLEEKACLTSLLKRNQDVFAWTLKDMPKIDPEVACYSLPSLSNKDKNDLLRNETKSSMMR